MLNHIKETNFCVSEIILIILFFTPKHQLFIAAHLTMVVISLFEPPFSSTAHPHTVVWGVSQARTPSTCRYTCTRGKVCRFVAHTRCMTHMLPHDTNR